MESALCFLGFIVWAFRCDKNNIIIRLSAIILSNDNQPLILIKFIMHIHGEHKCRSQPPPPLLSLSLPPLLSHFSHVHHTSYLLITLEPNNDLDTIYKVLKKAGEMSAAAERNQTATTPMKEIPVVNINVPDYPDREPRMSSIGGASSRGPLKPTSGTSKQGLTAPMADISSSGRVLVINFTLQIFSHFISFTFLALCLYRSHSNALSSQLTHSLALFLSLWSTKNTIKWWQIFFHIFFLLRNATHFLILTRRNFCTKKKQKNFTSCINIISKLNLKKSFYAPFCRYSQIFIESIIS